MMNLLPYVVITLLGLSSLTGCDISGDPTVLSNFKKYGIANMNPCSIKTSENGDFIGIGASIAVVVDSDFSPYNYETIAFHYIQTDETGENEVGSPSFLSRNEMSAPPWNYDGFDISRTGFSTTRRHVPVETTDLQLRLDGEIVAQAPLASICSEEVLSTWRNAAQ